MTTSVRGLARLGVVVTVAGAVAAGGCGKKQGASPEQGPGAVASGAAQAPATPVAVDAAGTASAAGYTVSHIALPGVPPDGVWMDILRYAPATRSVWVPAGSTGAVDVIDTATGKLTQVGGFATKEFERRGHKRVMGPSAAAPGDGVVYVGNRGDSTICAIDAATLKKGACGTLDAMPDCVEYVAPTHEVWVTTPRDKSIRILDGKTLKQKARLAFDGEPEGYAVDAAGGRFFTNLEDKDLTLAIDLKTHATTATWKPACGEEGPHGLAFDADRGLLFVACSAKAEVLDVRHDGAVVGSIGTGDGVDLLDYVSATRRLYVAAGRAGTLTIADVGDGGALRGVAVVPTADGARNGVVDGDGKVYLAHSAGGDLVVVTPKAGSAAAPAPAAAAPAKPSP